MMKILTEESAFYKIPDTVPPVQALCLDGIRHAIEFAEFSYNNLDECLSEIGINIKKDRNLGAFTAPFHYAWAVVDSIDRVRGLFKCMPGLVFESESSDDHRYFEETKPIRNLRNVSDHLGQRAHQIVAQNGTALGTLKWLVPLDGSGDRFRSCAVVPGTLRQFDPVFVMPKNAITGKTGQITLLAGEHEANLTEALEKTRGVIEQIEAQLNIRWKEDYLENGSTIGVDGIFSIDLERGKGTIPEQAS